MPNNRAKGARGERYFKQKLIQFFPNIRRNAGTQAQSGGVDLENTDDWDFEVKVGKQCVIKKVRGWLDQVQKEGKKDHLKVVLCHPEREQDYVIMDYDSFEFLMGVYEETKRKN